MAPLLVRSSVLLTFLLLAGLSPTLALSNLRGRLTTVVNKVERVHVANANFTISRPAFGGLHFPSFAGRPTLFTTINAPLKP